jgi:hypothetical protein
MSIDAMPLREAAHATAPTTVLPDEATPPAATRPSPADRVPTATLIAHAVDRAEARLERLRDQLDQVRADSAQPADVDVEEIRLLAAVAEAERERDTCRSLAAPAPQE